MVDQPTTRSIMMMTEPKLLGELRALVHVLDGRPP
jgi:hypothetical protein